MGQRRIYDLFEVFPVVDGIASVLMGESGVMGVALTGSAVRWEFPCRDVDIVVLHNGDMVDGSASLPSKEAVSYCYGPDLGLRNLLSPRVFELLPASIPADYIFVNEKALWDCGYLQSLRQIERFPDFYLRIFTEIPLVLFRANEARGRIRQYLDKEPRFNPELSSTWRIRHSCDDPKCKPRTSWEEEQREIDARKERRARV